MAETDVKKCLSWMVEQQEALESEKFGQNQAAVSDGAQRQKTRSREIDNRKNDVDRLVKKYKLDQSEAKKLSTSYSSLKAVSDKRTSCYDVISQIASLEDAVEDMSIGFDARAVHLCNIADKNSKEGNKTQSNESLAKTAQKCISGVRTNWAWIRKLVHCSDCHLKNAAYYHEFFHEIDEAEYFMNSTLAKIHLTFNPKTLQGDAGDARQILVEMKDVLLAYLTWQSKVDNLFDRAKEIVPVPERLKKLEEPRPAVALTDYKTDKVTFLEHETVTLLDTSDKKNWVIKTESGQSGTVPAITLLIPGPSGEALDAAIRMRIELLSLWTASIKRLGFQMIAFMLMVVRDWNDEEVKCLQSLPEEDREELLRILKFIEDTLMPNWKDYPDFQELQERILRTRMILEEAPDSDSVTKDPTAASVIVQVKLLEDMLNRYKDFGDYWETYKVMVESMREPKFLLVADPKDTMKFVSTAHVASILSKANPSGDFLSEDDLRGLSTLKQTTIPGENLGSKGSESGATHSKSRMSGGEGGDSSMSSTSTTTLSKSKMSSEQGGDSSMSSTSTTKVSKSGMSNGQKGDSSMSSTSTTILSRSGMSGEQGGDSNSSSSTTYWDTTVNVNQLEGDVEIEPISAQTVSVTESPKKDLEAVTSDLTVSTETEQVESEDVMSSLREEATTFVITSVLNPRDDTELTLQDAIMLGIIDQTTGRYNNPDTGESYSISDAMNMGKLGVEFKSRKKIRDEKSSFGLITIKTTRETRPYSIKSVVHPRTKQKMSVAEACDENILDTRNQTYVAEGGAIPVTDAIQAKLVEVEFSESDRHHKPETVTRTYAVNSVVDQRRSKKVPFNDAIIQGLLDKETGMYFNNVTRTRMNVSSAIMKGFIKARVVTDASKLDIDPENKIVVEKFTHAKTKLLGAMRAVKKMKQMNGN